MKDGQTHSLNQIYPQTEVNEDRLEIEDIQPLEDNFLTQPSTL